LLALLAACGSQTEASTELTAAPAINLPDVSMLQPNPGCKVVSADPAQLLPGAPDGNGGYLSGRRASVRFQADCLPPVSDPSPWWKPYRITYEQAFSLPADTPGAPGQWRAGAAMPVIDYELPKRPVAAVADGMGQNCIVLLDRIESETLPCMKAKAPPFAAVLTQALQGYRAKSQYVISVHDQNHLNTLRLERDGQCLHHWRETQRELLAVKMSCAAH
jgi:hypothetical protein